MGLHLTPAGQKLMRDAERTAAELEREVGGRLTASESRTLIRLLQKNSPRPRPKPLAL